MISGLFFSVVPPFSNRFTDSIFVYGDLTVSALPFANILGLSDLQTIPKKYIHRESDMSPHHHINYDRLYINVADFPKVLADLGWNPEDLKKMFAPEKLARVAPRRLGLPAPRVAKKREIDQVAQPPDLSDDLIKLFAKRYITENPQKVREVIFERLIGQNVEEFIKKL